MPTTYTSKTLTTGPLGGRNDGYRLVRGWTTWTAAYTSQYNYSQPTAWVANVANSQGTPTSAPPKVARRASWFRFPKITIPATATIASATLYIYANMNGSPGSQRIAVSNTKSPLGTPSTAGSVPSVWRVISQNNAITTVEYKSIGGSPDIIDVTTMVTTLFNTYKPYEGHPMLFTIADINTVTIPGASPTAWSYINQAVAISTGNNSGQGPQLIISYTTPAVPTLQDKTTYVFKDPSDFV